MSRSRVAAPDIAAFISDAMMAVGLPVADAAKVAELMVEADLVGADAHGVFRLPQYIRRIQAGGINPKASITVSKTAPATAIFAYDLKFYDQMPKLSPTNPTSRESWMQKPQAEIEEAAFRSGTLQAGYFMLAARAVGLDCGAMSGFSNAGVDKEFFAGTSVKSNFLCNLGYGSDEGLRPRAPRLDFDEACRIL